MREVRVCVLPLPGPARMARVSAKEDTAACWEGLRFERRPLEFIVLGRVEGWFCQVEARKMCALLSLGRG